MIHFADSFFYKTNSCILFLETNQIPNIARTIFFFIKKNAMKKIYSVLVALLLTTGAFAQCLIDTTQLPLTGGGIFPSAAHLHHIVKDSLYDQTVQGKIQDTMSMNFGGFVSVSIRVDSVRLDTINGLPNGIAWVKNPNVLRGGGYGCVEFTGTTSDTAGVYPIQPRGMIWAHLSVPLLGINVDTFSYGSLSQLQPFNNYYVVVDSAQLPLSVTITSANICFGDVGTGRVTAHATGGSATASYSYLWNTASTSYTLTNLNVGTYTVTVTCGSETATATVNVVAEQTPITLTLSSDSSTNGTNGTAIVVATGGVSPYRYFWNNGANTDTITGLAIGTYRVTVRDSFNCIARDSIIVLGYNTGIGNINDKMPTLSLFPNPATDVLNVVIETPVPALTRIEAVDITGRIIYSASVNIAGRYTKILNLEKFGAGVYWLQITSGNQTTHKQFVVAK